MQNKLKPGTTAYKNEFNKLNYKQLKIEIKPDKYNLINDYCKVNNVSKASFIVKACEYIINNNIKLD